MDLLTCNHKKYIFFKNKNGKKVRIYNKSDLSFFKSLTFERAIWVIKVVDNTLYVGQWGCFSIVDLENIVLLREFETENLVHSIEKSGNLVLIGQMGGILQIYD